MSDSPFGNQSGIDASKLSDKDKQELQQFLANESQKAKIQNSESHMHVQLSFLKGILSRRD
jgi:hypothetical protein